MKLGWIKGLLISLYLGSLPWPGLAQSSLDEVVVVSSSENTYFRQTVETLRKRVDERVAIRAIDIDSLSTESGSVGKRLFVTLGLKAAIELKQLNPQARVISAYITREQQQTLRSGPGDTAVLLDQPLIRYLVFSKLMLGIDSLGVIERQPLLLAERETRILQQYQLQLHQHRIDSDKKLLPVLRELLARNDALLMLPRQTIYNRDSLKGVLLTGYRNRKPVVSYSPAHVRSGALASIYSSPVDIGRHLALVVNRSLEQPRGPATFEYARLYSIATNAQVARALSITLPQESVLRRNLDELEP